MSLKPRTKTRAQVLEELRSVEQVDEIIRCHEDMQPRGGGRDIGLAISSIPLHEHDADYWKPEG